MPRPEGVRIADARNQSGGDRRTNTGDPSEAPIRFAEPVPREDALVRIGELPLHQRWLTSQCHETVAPGPRHAYHRCLSLTFNNPLYAIAANAVENPNPARCARHDNQHRAWRTDAYSSAAAAKATRLVAQQGKRPACPDASASRGPLDRIRNRDENIQCWGSNQRKPRSA